MILSDVKVGQKVKYITGEVGTVLGTVLGFDGAGWVGLKIPGFAVGRSLDGRLLPDNSKEGWWVSPTSIELLHDVEIPLNRNLLPSDPAKRKKIPVASGVFDYFPAALAEIAKVSQAGNDQHNPGEPLHWSRGKSQDHADTAARHFLERGTLDSDGQRHLAKCAWRILALLQLELEAEGAPIARGAK